MFEIFDFLARALFACSLILTDFKAFTLFFFQNVGGTSKPCYASSVLYVFDFIQIRLISIIIFVILFKNHIIIKVKLW